jgi:hypothetical protein
MRARAGPGLTVVALAALAGGCNDTAPTATTHAPIPSTLAVRTMELDPSASCAGVGLADVIHGDPSQPDPVWLESLLEPGLRQRPVFPSGFRAAFDPALEIVDGQGRVAFREGDFIDGGCVLGQPNELLLVPTFAAYRLDCGPIEPLDCSLRAPRAAGQSHGDIRPIAAIRFTAADGHYQVLFEDGTTAEGSVPAD